jgi:hypothetical protein
MRHIHRQMRHISRQMRHQIPLTNDGNTSGPCSLTVHKATKINSVLIAKSICKYKS